MDKPSRTREYIPKKRVQNWALFFRKKNDESKKNANEGICIVIRDSIFHK